MLRFKVIGKITFRQSKVKRRPFSGLQAAALGKDKRIFTDAALVLPDVRLPDVRLPNLRLKGGI